MRRRGVVREPFGTGPNGQDVSRWVLSSGEITLGLVGLGASVQSLEVPDRDGEPSDVVLGFDDLAGYLAADQPFVGAIVGRYAGRIADGRFELDGAEHTVPRRSGSVHALHGGTEGFDRRWWDVDADPATSSVRMSLHSRDGDMGFPGALDAAVTYTVVDRCVRILLEATTDRTTVVNLTNHAYFNLGGTGAGSATLERHELTLTAGRFLPVTPAGLPLGELRPVAGTPMDFTTPKPIGRDLRHRDEQIGCGCGFDHTWVLDAEPGPDGLRPAARLREPASGRVLEVRTDQPGVQVYTANGFDGSLVGRTGRRYRQGDGVALETQHFPDSPNRPAFPPTVLHPGERYVTATEWRFG